MQLEEIQTEEISIHALREEGDGCDTIRRWLY